MSALTRKDLNPVQIREMMLAGYRAEEIAEALAVNSHTLRNFMMDHGISRSIDLHEPAPKTDYSRSDKIITYHLQPTPCSGHRRVSRVSLPRLSIQAAPREERP